jgi:hypothetical protein
MNEGADVFTGAAAGSSGPMPARCQKVLRKGCSDLCGTPGCCWWPHVPDELDLVGFDTYEDTGAAEVAAVRAYAEACVFPSMHSEQRFVAVPGCFAQHNNTTTPQLMDKEDATVADKVDAYAAWAVADARVGGVKPWHWDDRAMTEEGGRFWLGASSLPKTRKRLKALGQAMMKSDDAENDGGSRCASNRTVADIQSTGSVNLLHFGAVADGLSDDANLTREAISCSNRVFVPVGSFLINSTIVLADEDRCPGCASIGQNVELHGVGAGKHPSSTLMTHSREPVIQLGDFSWKFSDGASVTLQDLSISAVRVGVLVVGTSGAHLTRIMVRVSEWGAEGPPAVSMPVDDHAALVVSDTYWLYISGCQFTGATPPNYHGGEPTVTPCH